MTSNPESFQPHPSVTDGFGDSEMGRLIRNTDWSKTAFGPIDSWPASLRTILGVALGSRFPMLIWWGPRLLHLYNDAYRPILRDKHPASLGAPAAEIWAEIWDVAGPLAQGVLDGGPATWTEDLQLFINSEGRTEETYFTFSYSPIPGDDGRVGGLLNTVQETTAKVQGERQIRMLHDLAERAADAKSEHEAYRVALEILSANNLDLPFVLLYAVNADGDIAQLAGAGGWTSYQGSAVPAQVPLNAEAGAGTWPLFEVIRSGRSLLVDDLAARFGALPMGQWNAAPGQALLLPLARPGQLTPYAVLVAGISPHRGLDDRYQRFFQATADKVMSVVANARAYEDESKRAAALAEIDRAKTAFFSNVSHELRTPLTLMLGPLEDELGERDQPLPAARRERIDIAHRNSLRLLKLVNVLLDFARIESGRMQAHYLPTDLAALTADLASSFRSATERAGLQLTIDCQPLPAPIYVDRDMWEKIVLNLLSNAFKHTFEGGIAVRLTTHDNTVQLVVEDTGIGIPAEEMPKLFDRFHRVKGAASRTHEGTGIGLSLTRELVQQHEGRIDVDSKVGKGSRFTVTLKSGQQHLPVDRVGQGSGGAASGNYTVAFVKEALHWLPSANAQQPAVSLAVSKTAHQVAPGTRPRILWADDNVDMRDYVARLLGDLYEVQAVADGQAALEAALADPPDLVLSDVMMPRLDGFALLEALRNDERTRRLPVILLSARAGEEAAIEGLDAGADDYLVKPFSAKELLARVRANLLMGQRRREWEVKLEEANRRLAASAEAKGQFLASMSHEIRTPMNAVLGILQLLQRTDLSGRQTDYVDKALTAGQSLLRLINEILDFSKIDAGKLSLEIQPFRLDTLMRDLSAILSDRIGTKNIEVMFSIDQRLRSQLLGDQLRLQQILLNLASNAIKFTESGEVVVSAKVVSHEAGRSEIEFAVRDTGIGIDPSKLSVIFDAFTQADASTTRRFGGTGLGLAISRRLVELMGGQLQVESVIGRGSYFHFRIQLDHSQVPEPTESVTATIRAMKDRRLRVLVVDDIASARDVIGTMVRSFGWHSDEASGGQAALAMVEQQQIAGRPYDVVFLDWQMPELNGIQTAGRIRALKKSGHTPVIVMVTAHERAALAQQVDKQRDLIDGFLIKPLTASMLLDSVIDAHAKHAEQATKATTVETAQRLAGLKLLVVEDNAVNQVVASELLMHEGAEVVVAGGGKLGVEQALSAQPAFDAVLMDIQMPDMDGYDATRLIRAEPRMKDLPIIAVTANAMESDRKACLEAGMNDHLGKPIDIGQVVTTLLLWCRRKTGDERAPTLSQASRPPVPDAERASLIELDEVLLRFNGNRNLFVTTGQRFCEQGPDVLADLRRHLESGELRDVAISAHTLKGMAATVGAQRLADFAARLQQSPWDNDSSFDLAGQIRLLDELLHKTILDLKDVLQLLGPVAPQS